MSENDGDAVRGQPAKWLGRGPSPETEYFALTAFMYEGPEGCAKEPLPAKTSEPVLEAAKCLLTPKLKGAGWTLLELGPESWFRHSSQDCHFCLALTVGSSRSHILVPLNAVHEGTHERVELVRQRIAKSDLCQRSSEVGYGSYGCSSITSGVGCHARM